MDRAALDALACAWRAEPVHDRSLASVAIAEVDDDYVLVVTAARCPPGSRCRRPCRRRACRRRRGARAAPGGRAAPRGRHSRHRSRARAVPPAARWARRPSPPWWAPMPASARPTVGARGRADVPQVGQALGQVDRLLAEPDGERDRLAHRVQVGQLDDVLAEQAAPGAEHLAVAGVGGARGQDVVGVPAPGELRDQVADGERLRELVADPGADLTRLDPRVGHLVADDEQVAALAALLEAVDARVPGHEVHGQLVGLGLLAAASALEQDVLEVAVHPVVGLELADLQRRPVAGRVADRAEHDLRVRDVAVVLQQAEELRQLLLQGARHAAHRAGDVEQDGDRERLRVLVAVAALPLADVERVEARVHAVRPRVAVGEGALAAAQPLGGLVDIC